MSGPNGNGNGSAQVLVPARKRRSEEMEAIEPTLDERRLAEWMEEVTDPERGDWQCWHFKLDQKHPERGLDTVTQEPIAPTLDGHSRSIRVARVVSLFAKAAKGWADESATRTVFVVAASRTTSPDPQDEQPEISRFPFAVTPSRDAVDRMRGDFGVSLNQVRSDSSPQVIGHLQRSLDVMATLVAKHSQSDKDRLVELFEKQAALNERLMADRFKMFMEQERLAEDRMTRELRAREKALELDTQNKLVGALFTYGLPIGLEVLKQKTGIKLPDAVTEHPMIAFAKKLSPAQLLDFREMLTPAQQEEFAAMGEQLAQNFTDAQKKELVQIMQARGARKMAEMQAAAEANAKRIEAGSRVPTEGEGDDSP